MYQYNLANTIAWATYILCHSLPLNISLNWFFVIFCSFRFFQFFLCLTHLFFNLVKCYFVFVYSPLKVYFNLNVKCVHEIYVRNVVLLYIGFNVFFLRWIVLPFCSYAVSFCQNNGNALSFILLHYICFFFRVCSMFADFLPYKWFL